MANGHQRHAGFSAAAVDGICVNVGTTGGCHCHRMKDFRLVAHEAPCICAQLRVQKCWYFQRQACADPRLAEEKSAEVGAFCVVL